MDSSEDEDGDPDLEEEDEALSSLVKLTEVEEQEVDIPVRLSYVSVPVSEIYLTVLLDDVFSYISV